jgi:hypothetical protein
MCFHCLYLGRSWGDVPTSQNKILEEYNGTGVSVLQSDRHERVGLQFCAFVQGSLSNAHLVRMVLPAVRLYVTEIN